MYCLRISVYNMEGVCMQRRKIAVRNNFIVKELSRNKYIYLMLVPVVLWYIIFMYLPMYGEIIAFKDFRPARGILGSPWVGFDHFKNFFNDIYFGRIIKNTILISIYDIIWGFPAPIILALLLNELRGKLFKRTVQTLTYLPYFVAMVVVCGIIKDFVSSEGLITQILSVFGFEKSNMLGNPKLFRTIYVSTNIWQGAGWGSIIYLAAISGIDPSLYEAAVIDGAGKWKQALHITLPGISSTMIILLILRLGSIMNVGHEKIILLYNPIIYETADVISSYVYRKGLMEFNYSYSAAVGLFNSFINLIFLLVANQLSRKVSESSLF